MKLWKCRNCYVLPELSTLEMVPPSYQYECTQCGMAAAHADTIEKAHEKWNKLMRDIVFGEDSMAGEEDEENYFGSEDD